uniref:Membrane-bound lytic murein transglycosylase B (EC) n=1 Tax=uncultured Thiotrichaceae bacterium TaxID=298394 RepID=A0A6S6U5S4_9GAMM|nr:MAG: Membrane-bound lytic murein transglycosylase B precursor (EC [uncultured Thiotrichaceae bacterium]
MVRIIQLAVLFITTLFGYSLVVDNDFELWKTEFRQSALDSGIQSETLDIAFTGLLPDRKVLRLDSHQPEFTRPVWEYLENTTSDERVQLGRQRLAEYGELLTQISNQYGVDKFYVLAIWGMESSFGKQTGNYSVIRSLATLAYGGREARREFWGQQLVAALRLIQSGDMYVYDLRGSWAGAIGHTQFMPITLEAYAVDFDGDGRRDLIHSIPDALASTANYLAKSGWQEGQEWGEEVKLPDNFDWNQADPKVLKPAQLWTVDNQILPISGGLLADGAMSPASVYLPAGYHGPAFVLYQNFNAILKYNRSTSYALAVGQLADRLRNKSGVIAEWPYDDVALSHEEKAELQLLLSAAGYNTEGIDGKIGPNTQSALRRWQSDVGVAPDGYATVEYLKLLRKQVDVKPTTVD